MLSSDCNDVSIIVPGFKPVFERIMCWRTFMENVHFWINGISKDLLETSGVGPITNEFKKFRTYLSVCLRT